MAYSTQTRLTNKIRTARLTPWADKDKDGSIDAATMTQALSYAKNVIDGYVGMEIAASTIAAWTDTTVPPLLADISDDLAIYWLCSSANAVVISPPIEAAYQASMELLRQLRAGELRLFTSAGVRVEWENPADIEIETEIENADDDYVRVFPLEEEE